MLDIRFVREHLDEVATAMQNRNHTWDSARFQELDESRRASIAKEEELQAKRNTISKSIGKLMGEGKKEEAEAAKAEVSELKEQIAKFSAERAAADEGLRNLLLATPNMPADSTPVGKDENDNPEVRRWGTPRNFEAEGIEMKPHWDLGAELGIIDAERAVKLAGSRFVLLGGLGARLERALINFMADTHTSRGYKEWWCPAMANATTLTGTGQLPKFEDDLFKTREGMYLIPTAEVQLTNIHSGEVLEASDLPLKYCAFTPCFREEAGSAGRDTRGLIRVHQFDKVEMVKYAKPEESYDDLESMVADAENILQLLGLPYRVISLCTATSDSPPPRRTTWKYGFPLTMRTRKSPLAPTARTSRLVAPTSSTATPRTSRARVLSTRLTVPVWRLAARWLPLSRTTSRQTAPSRFPMFWFPTWVASRLSAKG